MITVINEDVRSVEADTTNGRVLLNKEALQDAIGWELKPQGLCRADVCVPMKDTGPTVDLQTACQALGRPVVVDTDTGVVAVALPSEERKRTLDGLLAAPFTLPDLDGAPHSLSEWHGRKKLLTAFSTW
jgi:hypothetical protein